MLAVPARTRRSAAVVAAGAAVALLVAGVSLAPADGSPSDDVALASSDATARSSAALARALTAQTRVFAAAPAAPAAERATAATRSTTRAAQAPTGVGPIVFKGLPVLEPGARHTAVKRLQKLLGVKATGWYGPMTLAKVVEFQKSRDLPARGYVGLRTWQALFEPAPAASTTTRSSSSSGARTVSAPVTAGRVCPAPGSTFGSGWGAPRGSRSHMGVDLMGPRGMPILAIESGSILRAGYQSNGAIRVVQQGVSGSKFYYGHFDSITVRAGSAVKRGQVIGYMGDTGSPGAVHLHFEYWKSGGESAAVDPYPLLKSLCW